MTNYFLETDNHKCKMAYRDDKTGDILHKKSQLAVIKQPISPLKHT